MLELLLWEAERAWAEGLRSREEVALLERKQQQQQQQPLAQKRHRAIRRLLKASQHAEKLSSLLAELGESFSTSTSIQAEVYALYMQGYYSFALASSSSAAAAAGIQHDSSESPSASTSGSPAANGAKQLSLAYVLLESFATNSNRATEEALAFEVLDELEPMIRFCAYRAEMSSGNSSVAETARKLGKEQLSSKPASKAAPSWSDLVDKHKVETQQQAASSTPAGRGGKGKSTGGEPVVVTQLQWRDVDVPVRSAELAAALGKVESVLESLESKEATGGSVGTKKQSRPTPVPTAVAGGSSRSMATYDRALAVLSEAEDRARKLVDDNNTALSKAQSARFEAASKPLKTAHAYITLQLLCLRIRRDDALFASSLANLRKKEEGKKLRKPKARRQEAHLFERYGPLPRLIKRRRAKALPVLIKLLEVIIQSLEQLRELPLVEDDSQDLASVVDASIAYDKARK